MLTTLALASSSSSFSVGHYHDLLLQRRLFEVSLLGEPAPLPPPPQGAAFEAQKGRLHLATLRIN
jgi:hypothetical protein